ncbi:hypothetical protein Taro_038392 [Colocasia esculenta]|uniref:aldehyde oxygenase (deformylating) n=1 Tax=Colocasia esculenta TaxID=4460 RepID=A0A843WDS1_COLES|nr:hypothetical protein [Colocasia esculenta]
MLHYRSVPEAEAVLQRNLTTAEAAWLRYSAGTHDLWLYFHNIIFLLVVYTLAPLPLAVLELTRPDAIRRYKVQPKVPVSLSAVLRCYRNVVCSFLLTVGPLQILSYPTVKWVGIRTGLPLPTWWEATAQVGVYVVVEDYANYWVHRAMHTPWGYEKIHHVHHEFTVPVGFAAPYAHWAELLLLGVPSFLGPALVPCHITVFWLWMVLRHVEAIETHCGYDFPHTPTKYIPFYGGAEYHDYHHFVGRQSQSNFASIFTYCDYIYGTDKGYRYHKDLRAKIR